MDAKSATPTLGHDAVRRWTSDFSGMAIVRLAVLMNDTSCVTDSADGVEIFLYHNSQQEYSQELLPGHTSELTSEYNIHVSVGDTLDLVVRSGNNDNCDKTLVDLEIEQVDVLQCDNVNFETNLLLNFAYYNASVQQLTPDLGLVSGDTWVTLRGNFVITGDPIQVQFDSKLATDVQAVALSTVDVVIYARAPSSINLMPSIIHVEVALNGIQFTDSQIRYRYYEDPILSSVSPDFARVSGSDFDMILEGGLFVDSFYSNFVRIQIRDLLGEVVVDSVNGTFIDESTIRFPPPSVPIESGTLRAFLSLNAQQYSVGFREIIYYGETRNSKINFIYYLCL